MASLEGQTLGQYQVISQMGSGGMATVYKAYHPRLDRYVAIKMLHEAFQEDENFLARFQREAQIVARLEHPHIVPVFDFDDFNGRPYLVMKYVEGRTLKAVLDQNPLSMDEILRILPPVAQALDYAHGQGVLHRDIKPSNIIIDQNGVPYLTDFGLARMATLGESTLSHDVLLGTPHYISPEQAMGSRDLDAHTDLYSLGVVLYELVVGRVPFSADTPFAIIHDHIYRPLPVPSRINPEITPEVDKVLQKALAKAPADRYHSASEMIAAFQQAVQTSGLKTLNPERVSTASESLARLRDEQNQTTPPASVPAAPSVPAPGAPPAPPRPPFDEDDYFDEFDRPSRRDIRKAKREAKREVRRVVEHSLDFSQAGRVFENAGAVMRSAIEEMSDAFDQRTDFDLLPLDDEQAIRHRVEYQLKKRGEFVGHLVAFIFVNLLLWVIYGGSIASNIVQNAELQSLMHFPWPMIVTLGWGSGLAAHFIELIYETGGRARRRAEAVQMEFQRTFGEDWPRADRKELRRIRRRVEQSFNKRREFFQHFAVYVLINLMLWFIFAQSLQLGGQIGDVVRSVPFPWPILVTFGWGIGLVINGLEVLTAQSRERTINRAVERERRLLYGDEKRKRVYEPESERGVRLGEDGEFTDSMVEEMEADEKLKRSGR